MMIGKHAGRLVSNLIIAVLLVVIGVGVGLALTRTTIMESFPVIGPFFYEDRPATTTTGPTVVEGIRDLDQLATVRWTESVPVTRENGGTAFERIFEGERVLLIAVGQVEAGIDLAEIETDDVSVNDEENSVTIDLPEPEILSASLEEERTEVYDRDFSPLNIRPDDDLVDEAREAAVEQIEIAARRNGILEQAEANAETSIEDFLLTVGYDEVNFE